MKKMLALLIATLLLFPLVAFADAKDTYNQAQELLAQSKYSEAAKLFESISTYEDASKLAMYCKACALCESGYFDMGITAFEALGEFKDCPMRITYYQARATEYVAGESDWIAMEAALAAYSTIPVFLDSFERIMALNTRIETAKTTDYNAALALMQAGRYEEAIEAFRELRGYKDSVAQINACNVALTTQILDTKYNSAVSLMNAGKYSEAIAVFSEIKTHRDSAGKIQACETAMLDEKYNAALALIAEEKYREAYNAFISLNGYKDSVSIADSIYVKTLAETYAQADVGDYIVFGAYNQDNNDKNGKDPIEWIVLAKENNRILVISRYALFREKYHSSKSDVTWEVSTLRQTLNNSFFDVAFNEAEQGLIPTVMVSAEKNSEYNTNPGRPTEDKIFILSPNEVKKYLPSEKSRQCKPSAAVASNLGLYTSSGFCRWWLRSPGENQDTATSIDYNGGICIRGRTVNYLGDNVRPALWIQYGPMDEAAMPSSPTPESTPIPTSTATAFPTATPAPTVTYKSLKQGSKGDDVITMKKRLQELGYFTAGASLSNQYNGTTTERVKLFQKVNGLKQTGVADEATLQLLFSDDAKKNPN